MSLYWPIGLIVLSNVFYHICAKSMPDRLDPFAALTVTYTVGAVVSLIFYFITSHGGNLIQEYHNVNWTPFILGLAIVGLEAGSLYMYKVGWNVNTGSLVANAILAVALLVVGFLLYNESITLTKAAGVIVCMIGIVLLNK